MYYSIINLLEFGVEIWSKIKNEKKMIKNTVILQIKSYNYNGVIFYSKFFLYDIYDFHMLLSFLPQVSNLLPNWHPSSQCCRYYRRLRMGRGWVSLITVRQTSTPSCPSAGPSNPRTGPPSRPSRTFFVRSVSMCSFDRVWESIYAVEK